MTPRSMSTCELGRRLRMLLDVAEVRVGEPVPYPAIRDFVESRGAGLSRTKWHYMVNGVGPANRDPRLLELLAEFFDVDRDYLTSGAPTPSSLTRHESAVVHLRARRACAAFRRELGGAVDDAAAAELDRIARSALTRQRDSRAPAVFTLISERVQM